MFMAFSEVFIVLYVFEGLQELEAKGLEGIG